MRLSLNNPECRAKGQIKFRSSIAVCNQIIFDTPETEGVEGLLTAQE